MKTYIALILGATIMAGCSKSPNPQSEASTPTKSSQIPHISFVRYGDYIGGLALAYFKAQNPSQSLIVCKVQGEPDDDSNAKIIGIPARGSVTFFVFIRTNTVPSLSVKVVRLVTVHELTVPMPDRFTVPMPNTAPEPTATGPSIFDATLTLDYHTNMAEPAAGGRGSALGR
jgi:hypothetical protein